MGKPINNVFSAIERLIEWLEKSNLTVYKFAKVTGICTQTAYAVTQRKNHINLATLRKIALKWRKLSLHWLITGEGEMYKDYSEHDNRLNDQLAKQNEEIERYKKIIDMLSEQSQLIKNR